MSFVVVKADGTSEEFKSQKLFDSLTRAGADESDARDIVTRIEQELGKNKRRIALTTHEIYSHAFSYLRERKQKAAAHYSLKKAVGELGPSGFPFELYLAKLFEGEGYTTKVDQIIKGACVEHEVDVVLTKDGQTTYVEAKFHNAPGFKTDLKVALYVAARIEDLRAAGHTEARGLLATNTKCTDKAIEYASCKGLDLLAWDYPEGHTLHDLIENTKLYPITALVGLSRREKMALLEGKIVLCNQLQDHPEELIRLGINAGKIQNILEEVGVLCSS